MKFVRYAPMLAVVGLLSACAATDSGPKYHDNMSRPAFTEQCAADLSRKDARVSRELAHDVCSCSFDRTMRAYGNNAAAFERAYRTNRRAFDRTLQRVTQACVMQAVKKR